MRTSLRLTLTSLFSLSLICSFAVWPFSASSLEEKIAREAALLSEFRSSLNEDLLSKMSLDEKIAQVFLVPFPSELVDADLRAQLKRLSISNIILYKWSNGLETRDQILELTSSLNREILINTGIPPMIATDQEGGRVFNLKPLTHLPSPMILGVIDDPKASRIFGRILGEEMLELGVNICLGPCADLANPNGPSVIGTRAISSSPEKVALHCENLISGLHSAGVLSVIKHAPGHGSTLSNSHYELPCVEKDYESLQMEDFAPFKALALHTDGMMSAHVIFPEVDSGACASFSPKILKDLIRSDWKFQGVLFSDSVTMAGAAPGLSSQSVAQAAIRALKAGNDCVIIGGVQHLSQIDSKDRLIQLIEGCFRSVKTAILSGEISEDELNASVLRILRMKKRMQLPCYSFSSGSASLDHENFSWEIAKKAIRTLSDRELFEQVDTTLDGRRVGIISPKALYERMQNSMATAKVLDRVPEVQSCFFSNQMLDEIGGVEKFADSLAAKQNELDIFLFLVTSSNQFPWQNDLIRLVAKKMPPEKLVFVGVDHPKELYDLGIHKTHVTLLSFSSTPCSLLTLSQILNDRSIPPSYEIQSTIHLPENNEMGENAPFNAECSKPELNQPLDKD
jgi:beta-glucosidase-like glycosyl hydrolase